MKPLHEWHPGVVVGVSVLTGMTLAAIGLWFSLWLLSVYHPCG